MISALTNGLIFIDRFKLVKKSDNSFTQILGKKMKGDSLAIRK